MNDTTIPPLKRCTKCGNEYPATREYFQAHKQQKSGLRPECKKCSQAFKKANWERYRETTWRQYYEANRQVLSDRFREWRLRNIEYNRNRVNNHYHQNREMYRERSRRNLPLYRVWQAKNRDRIRASARRFNANHPGYSRTYGLNRRARERLLPHTLTKVQWNACLGYFNHCCAACGRQLRDLFNTHTEAADHWIPLNHTDCPGTVADNIIPLCHGQGGCNNSKCDLLPEEWLVRKFGKRKAAHVLARVNAYFEWVRSQS